MPVDADEAEEEADALAFRGAWTSVCHVKRESPILEDMNCEEGTHTHARTAERERGEMR